MTMDAGMMEEIRDRQYYQKPSFKGHQLRKIENEDSQERESEN